MIDESRAVLIEERCQVLTACVRQLRCLNYRSSSCAGNKPGGVTTVDIGTHFGTVRHGLDHVAKRPPVTIEVACRPQ